MSVAFFRLADDPHSDGLVPQQMAAGGWGSDQMRGTALSGALARAAERTVAATGREDLRPTRWTVDLFRPAAMRTCRTRTVVRRSGRRVHLVDAMLEQDDRVVARASALFIQMAPTPEGDVWSPGWRPSPPPPDLEPVAREPRLYHSEGIGWTVSPTNHQHGRRKQTWHRAIPIVEEEEPSSFQMVASVADVANLVTNWGSAGLAFINADITLVLARLPAGLEVGLAARDRVVYDGIAVSTVVVYDRQGPLGTAAVSALANAHRAVDLRREWGFGAEPVPQR